MGVAGHPSGYCLCSGTVRQVRTEAADGALGSAQEDPTISEGDSGVRDPLQGARSTGEGQHPGGLDLPTGYLSSVSALEAEGVESIGYVDSDYANSLDDRRSITGYVNFIAEAPVTWQCKTQQSVA